MSKITEMERDKAKMATQTDTLNHYIRYSIMTSTVNIFNYNMVLCTYLVMHSNIQRMTPKPFLLAL